MARTELDFGSTRRVTGPYLVSGSHLGVSLPQLIHGELKRRLKRIDRHSQIVSPVFGYAKDGSHIVKISLTTPHSTVTQLSGPPVPPVGVMRMGTLKPAP